MGTIEDRNGMDLTETEDIKKRWQQYTEGLYKKDLHNPDNHDGGINHLEPRSRRITKEPLDESERGEWKSWLKAQHSEN